MQEYRIQHEVYYETREPIPLSDVIESLLGIQTVFKEIGPLLESAIPGLQVQKIEISVSKISEGSLQELVWATIFLTFQPELEKEVPNLLENIFGISVGHEYPAASTAAFCLLLYYAADFAYKKIFKSEGPEIKEHLAALVREVSAHLHVSEDRMWQILEERYGKGRARSLVHGALKVFRPSKQHSNAPMRISGRRIEPRVVAEVPGDAQMLDYDDVPPSPHRRDVSGPLRTRERVPRGSPPDAER